MGVPTFPLLLLLLLLHSATSFYVPQGSLVQSKLKTTLPGLQNTFKVWKSEKNDVFSFASGNENGFSGLFVFSNKIEYVVYENYDFKRGISATITPPLGVGWVTIEVDLGPSLKVTIPDHDTVLDIPMEKNDLMLKEIDIAGSNITINNVKGPWMWRVDGGGGQVVPLGGLGPHQVSLYTMTPSLPRVSVGGQQLTLVWDGQVMTSDQRFHLPLPAYRLHNMTVTCQDHSTDNLNCTLDVSGLKHPLVCPKEGCYLNVSARSSDILAILLEEPTLDLNWSFGGKLNQYSTTYVILIIIILLLLLAFCILGYEVFQKCISKEKIKQMSKLKEKHRETLPKSQEELKKHFL